MKWTQEHVRSCKTEPDLKEQMSRDIIINTSMEVVLVIVN